MKIYMEHHNITVDFYKMKTIPPSSKSGLLHSYSEVDNR